MAGGRNCFGDWSRGGGGRGRRRGLGGFYDSAGLGASHGYLIAGDAAGGGRFRSDEPHLFEEFLQRELDFLLAREVVAIAKDIGPGGGKAPQRDADTATGDFLGQLLDGKVDLCHRVVTARLDKVRRHPGQNIGEAQDDFLLFFARFWIGFRIARGGHASQILTKTVKRAKL